MKGSDELFVRTDVETFYQCNVIFLNFCVHMDDIEDAFILIEGYISWEGFVLGVDKIITKADCYCGKCKTPLLCLVHIDISLVIQKVSYCAAK